MSDQLPPFDPDNTVVSWATTEELIDELLRRCPRLLMIYQRPQSRRLDYDMRGSNGQLIRMLERLRINTEAEVRHNRHRREPPPPPDDYSPPPDETTSQGGC